MPPRRRSAASRLRPLLRRAAIAVLFAAVGSGLWYAEEREVRDGLSWMGVPDWQRLTPLSLHRVLRNDGYLVGWSDVRVGPLWVSYRLAAAGDARIGERPGFRRDWRTLWPVTPDSYLGSGYDRGHLAPNYAIAAVHGRGAQRDTFLMSNMVPQRPSLNRRLWQRLEEVVIDRFVPRVGALQVIAGPVFAPRFQEGALHRVGLVEVPVAFYKILVVPGARPRALAFVMPQEVSGDEPLDRFVVSIDRVEALTGLDFFPRLPVAAAEALEGRVDTSGWGLEAVARLPGRFD
ncbi:DNA/RNA non-specific endonuclease [Halomonas nitroreducens]|uniref:DNA/RNA non-specific endonuclease n=1 Tax=Halomonas nitroreducens TaxID=447425 RepID=A0A431V370_9GAMM|nr:DNA/RNA non-specific endonuclease [Halomonas nitroreducens]RTR03790.1 DNA/RNA non-specific endonuclease [Halomonas nitroreducens]